MCGNSQEHGAEVALKEELLRQEKLEQLAYKFERKSVLREGYLNEMIAVLSDPRWVLSYIEWLFDLEIISLTIQMFCSCCG